MKAMPTTHALPMELTEGQKGCGGCHKVGIKSEEEIAASESQAGSTFGHAACDSCHTRHTFSVAEAREPEACASCHMGFDHPQWEMYSTSKHGIRHWHETRRHPAGHRGQRRPARTCHMADGDHEVRTAWGFLAVRTNGLAPYPGESEQWWADRVTILQALGVLSPGRRAHRAAGRGCRRPGGAPERTEEFDKERAKMVKACSDCHSAELSPMRRWPRATR